jgi:CBS domain-containing protein
MVLLDDIRHIIFNTEMHKTVYVRDLMTSPPAYVSPNEPMESVMEKFEKIEMKIGVRKDLIEKAEKYNISLENFLNVRFRKYIENVIQNRDTLKKELDRFSGDERLQIESDTGADGRS